MILKESCNLRVPTNINKLLFDDFLEHIFVKMGGIESQSIPGPFPAIEISPNLNKKQKIQGAVTPHLPDPPPPRCDRCKISFDKKGFSYGWLSYGIPKGLQPQLCPAGIIWPMAPGCLDGSRFGPNLIPFFPQTDPKVTPKWAQRDIKVSPN